jgi:hypothetical protein
MAMVSTESLPHHAAPALVALAVSTQVRLGTAGIPS